jgi:putative ABC transport system permease protein
LEAVERFKDGIAVPEYGWSGSTPKAYPLYSGLVVILQEKLSKIEEVGLINNTGFTRIKALSGEELTKNAGYRGAWDRAAYLLATRKRPVGPESVGAVKHRLRGKGAVLIPWVKNLSADLVDQLGRTIRVLSLYALTLGPEDEWAIKDHPIPSWDDTGADSAAWRKVMLSTDMNRLEGPVSLRITKGGETLTFPVELLKEKIPEKVAFVPARLAGILNLFRQRSIIYDPETGSFILSRRGYAGFRLYAATIDDVEPLRRYLEDMGISVHTEASRIRDVTELDRYLSLMFWLIATVGLTGGVASLIASLYASVERKRRELSVLRLLGFSGATLFRFPIYQGVLIAAGGFSMAFAFFQALAGVINGLFQKHLQAEESLCYLSPRHLGLSLAGTVAVAVIAGTFAAWRTTRIDPAEALRDE